MPKTKSNRITEGNWAKEWKEFLELDSFYKVGDIVDYFGKRSKIIDDSGIDKMTQEEFYLLELIDEEDRTKMTWWASKREIRPWTGPRTLCECGAIHIKGSENLHSRWCPAYRRRDE